MIIIEKISFKKINPSLNPGKKCMNKNMIRSKNIFDKNGNIFYHNDYKDSSNDNDDDDDQKILICQFFHSFISLLTTLIPYFIHHWSSYPINSHTSFISLNMENQMEKVKIKRIHKIIRGSLLFEE